MPSLSLIEDADPEADPSPSLLTRASTRLFGDPRKAPRRLVMMAVFALFAFISIGVWAIANSQFETSGSSAPIVGPLLSVLTSVWLVPVLALWLTRRWVFFRRGRNASLAADISGWTTETIHQLRDEMQTTDGCTRIIASTGCDRADIEARIDAGLDGEYDDDRVDFWQPPEDETVDSFGIGHDDYADDEDLAEIERLREREAELVAEYNRVTDEIDAQLTDALDGEASLEGVFEADADRVSMYDLMDEADQAVVDEADALLEQRETLEAELESVRADLTDLTTPTEYRCEDAQALKEDIQQGYTAAIDLSDELYEAMDHEDFEYETEADDARTERDVPWRVRFMEEVKHLWLDLQSGFRTGDAVVKFGVPFGVTFLAQLFIVGLWTTVPVYTLFVGTSTLVGLFWYWVVKRRRQRRLRRYRAESTTDYWLDCAGQFKTVETADVDAYMGFIAGQRYASYDREEFVRKTARTMHQHVSDECVAPSDLEHYARSLEQMKPNLKGHRENVLRPLILRDLKETVETAEEQLIPKAELAWYTIEQPSGSRLQRYLGHDPELVADEYQWLVEEAHILDERDVAFMDASGETRTITLVFPAEKRRLPDVSERHSQFSDRFSDKKDDPVYELPDVDPRDGLHGFVPSPESAGRFDGAVPGEIAGGD